ncbi:MAG: hypothetical protein KME64_11170 [Scytonematopsis contorta HA4267-MV1]|nr:hypothetical protein [Scytonematopsis contorta HA4267-MV1]
MNYTEKGGCFVVPPRNDRKRAMTENEQWTVKSQPSTANRQQSTVNSQQSTN